MRYILLLTGLLLGAGVSQAQNTFDAASFSIPDVQGDNMTRRCLPVTVNDFSGGLAFSFGLLTDPDGALFSPTIQNITPLLPNFSAANFNTTTYAIDGLVTVDWQLYTTDPDCQEADGIFLDDGTVLFEICYQIDGDVASQHPVRFFAKPDDDPFDGVDDAIPLEYRRQCPPNPPTNSGQDGYVDGSITVGVRPLILDLTADEGIYRPGDPYCVDIVATSGFDNLKGYQFGINFDADVIRVTSVDPNEELIGNRVGNYTILEEGSTFYTIWTSSSDIPRSLPDGTRLATLCFEIVGDCRDRTDIAIGPQLRGNGTTAPVDANGTGAVLESIPVVTGGTRLVVDNCNSQGFDVIVGDCPADPVAFGTEVCVEMQAGEDFIDMTDIDYQIKWDPNVLAFKEIRDLAPGSDVNINDDFDTDRVDDGFLFFDWRLLGSNNFSLGEGESMYSVCFDVVGFGGVSPILVTDFINEILSDARPNPFSGVNPTNCSVTVAQPDGVALTFPTNTGFREGETTCFELLADGIDNVEEIQIFVASPPELNFVSGNSPQGGVTAASAGPGLVNINYSGAPFDLPNGSPLVTLCYQAQAGAEPDNGENCGSFDAAFPPPSIRTTESGINSLEVEIFTGLGCILFPNGFGMIVDDVTAPVDSNICVPVSVTQFSMITGVNTRFTFDPSVLRYTSVEVGSAWSGLSANDFDDSNVNSGVLDLSWSGSSTDVAGDTTAVFSICFNTTLSVECSPLTSADQPGATAVTTADGAPASIVHRSGEVCVEDRIVLKSVTPLMTSCDGSIDGGLVFDVATRPNNEDIFVVVDNPRRNGFVNDTLRGLRSGEITYTLFNASNTVTFTGTTTIEVDASNAATIVPPPDGVIDCTNTPVNINSRDNVGETWEFFRTTPSGGNRFVSEGTVDPIDGNIFTVATEPGTYILTVISAAGCTASDTVEISSVDLPVAQISQDLILSCDGPSSVTISGEGSSEAATAGTSVEYVWQSLNGAGEVIDTVGSERDLTVTDPGRYRLNVNFPDRNCTNSAFTIVEDGTRRPVSRLPSSATINCDGSPVVLTVGPGEPDVTYTWTTLGSDVPLSAGTTYSTSETGTYEVRLVNSQTGCSLRDTVVVEPSAGAPIIGGTAEIALNCNPDTTRLMVTYQNTNDNTTYRWTGMDGGVVLLDDLTAAVPRVNRAGTFRVIANNQGCIDSAFFTVVAPVLPGADAGADGELTCGAEFTLTGSGTSPGGATLSYQWSRNGMDVPMGAAASINVDQPGEYSLEVTDNETGCSMTDTVVLSAPTGFPVFELQDTVTGLGCAPNTVTLSVTVSEDVDYSYSWLDPQNTPISNVDTAVAETPGLYTLEITNNVTNCQATEMVLVSDEDQRPPRVSFTQEDKILTCETNGSLLDASASADGDNVIYFWEASNGGEMPREQGNDSLRVFTAGTYTLTVTDTVSNCEASRSVDVTDQRVDPNAVADAVTPLDCDREETTVSIQITDQPNDYSIQWIGPVGVDDLPDNVTSITVDQGGTYNAIVINPVTSCNSTVVFRVPDLRDSIAIIDLMPIDSFDCSATTVTIDASASTIRTQGSTIAWRGLDGNTVTPSEGSLTVAVDGPGDYEITVTEPSGCAIMDTITVAAGDNTPFADAGDPVEIECGEMPLLDGTGSTPPAADIIYEWTVVSGTGSIVSGGNTQTPIVSGPGVYQLAVTNVANVCSDVGTVEVMIAQQSAATLPADFNSCENEELRIEGNLPAGTSGSWTSFNDDGAVFATDNNVATISTIGQGISLVYTLTAPGCGPYSSDTITIRPEAAPVANDDLVEVGGIDNVGTINLLDNDLRTGAVTVRLLTEPEFGEIVVNLNGDITFEAPAGLTAVTSVQYEICSDACPDLCAEATLRISSQADGVKQSVFNAFTPNGDGMNETFFFQILDLRGDEFPNNELTVFNRWGDIIYEATPYNNDWDGTNNGTPVPEGTYYYILRLDIGEGEIIRGDVTIVR